MPALKWLPAFALIFLIFTSSCSNPRATGTERNSADSLPVVAVQKATVSDLSRSVALTAEFTPYQEVDVMSKVAGFVKQINVDIGDRVRTGQVLATIEVPEMADDLRKAAATVERSDAQIKQAQGEMQRALAAQEIAHISYQRLADVSKTKPGLVAQQELDDARTRDLSAEAQVAAAQSNIVAAQQQTAVNKADQARYQTLYNYSRVTAPFDGVVTMRYANTGSMIQAGTASQTQAMPLVRISQNSLLRLRLPVPESDVSKIHLGEEVDVRVPSLKRSFTGKVARFTDTLTTATRTMQTEVEVPNASLVLIPGMYAEVDLQMAHEAHVLSIPVSALDVTASSPRVFKVDQDGTVSIVPVTIGLETANKVEITSGLVDGDMVVVGDRASLKQGDKVKPKVVDIAGSQPES